MKLQVIMLILFSYLSLQAQDNRENYSLKETNCVKQFEELKKINTNTDNSIIKKYFNKILEKVENKYHNFKIYIENEYHLISDEELFDNIKNDKVIKVSNDKFIAHAGGIIDNKIYTNSLEALNENYKKGFRLFELDILKTKDGVYVAAHNWQEWKEKTDYKGEIPPTLKDFKKYKLYNKYTPLDINDINKWFCKHEDTILVSDKVKKPKMFAKSFIDNKRLIMELFSWKAINDGIELGINVMPTWAILEKLDKDIVLKKLKKLGIEYVAASRRILETNKELLKELLDNGIHVYAFHVNLDEGKDEKHVVCSESEYFYGLYADKWDFSTNLDCKDK